MKTLWFPLFKISLLKAPDGSFIGLGQLYHKPSTGERKWRVLPSITVEDVDMLTAEEERRAL